MKSENKEIISLSPQLQLKLDSETKPAALSEPQLASEPSASGTREHQRAPQPNSEASLSCKPTTSRTNNSKK